jgi:molybdopterin-containing oxidoreductase family membrane subunit
MYSGFGMVVVLAVAFRWGLRLEAIITRNHFEVMGKVLLMASIVMGYSYASEWFMAWYGGRHVDRDLTAFLFTGSYAPLYWGQLFCNVLAPQALWFRAVRRSLPALVVISILINIGMGLERILIVWNTLSHAYMPSLWQVFKMTFWDWSILIAPLGLFAFMFLLFVRLVPSIAMYDVRRLAHEEDVS